MPVTSNNKTGNIKKAKNYIKKIGLVGFLFFLVKGLIWLFVFLFIKSKV